MKRLPLLLAATLAMPGARAGTDTPVISVVWRDKPPYYYTEGGVEKGFLRERTRHVFDEARVPLRFIDEPTKRVWANLQAGKPNYCALGRYRNAERASYTQYTHALHVDPPQYLLTSPAMLENIRAHKTLAGVLADPKLEVGLIDGGSYGPELDAMVRAGLNKVTVRTVSSFILMRMVAAGRMSYTFADRYSWDYVRARDPLVATLTPVELPDMAPGMTRYLVCSRNMPPQVMQHLNKAIDKLRYADKPPTAAELGM